MYNEGNGPSVQVTVKVKAIADVMEALIGAFYLEGGMRGAEAAIQALGSWPVVHPKHEASAISDAMGGDIGTVNEGGIDQASYIYIYMLNIYICNLHIYICICIYVYILCI
jgi:hypothetical protein